MNLYNNRIAPVKTDTEIRSYHKTHETKGMGYLILLLIILAVIIILTFIYGGESKVGNLPENTQEVALHLSILKESLLV